MSELDRHGSVVQHHSHRDQRSGTTHTGGDRSQLATTPTETPEKAPTGDASPVAAQPCLVPWERLRTCALPDCGQSCPDIGSAYPEGACAPAGRYWRRPHLSNA